MISVESVEYWENLAAKLWPTRKNKEKALRETEIDIKRAKQSKYLENLQSRKTAIINLIRREKCYQLPPKTEKQFSQY